MSLERFPRESQVLLGLRTGFWVADGLSVAFLCACVAHVGEEDDAALLPGCCVEERF